MPKQKDKKVSPWLIVLPIILLVAIGAWQLLIRYEGQPPEIQLMELPSAIGPRQELTINVSDRKSGIRKIWVGILQNGKETVLLQKEIPSKSFFGGSIEKQAPFDITLEPEKIGLSDGEAVLRVSVWDYSWRHWWHGNVAYIEKTIYIDTKPPQIEVLSDSHNVSQGGTGLIIYRLSETCPQSGVVVGDNFFPGASGYFQDPLVYMCFFAVGYDQGVDTALSLKAVDAAGNTNKTGFYYHILKKQFKKDNIDITDSFLEKKQSEFQTMEGGDGKLSPLELFLKANGEIRAENFKSIMQITSQSDPVIYWKGAFERLPGSATRATYAEARDYLYKGKKIDHQTHLGMDLASIANSPVPAANAGRVAFTGRMGIYGNIVILDHGFGLFSLYAHMSSISVQEGQMLNKGDIMGHTGSTGMAGGDHLHFSMIVHDRFVNPLEWWDASWIENNITSKLARVPVKAK